MPFELYGREVTDIAVQAVSVEASTVNEGDYVWTVPVVHAVCGRAARWKKHPYNGVERVLAPGLAPVRYLLGSIRQLGIILERVAHHLHRQVRRPTRF
jgi:hypothetical protein